jgi:hypothetical protein
MAKTVVPNIDRRNFVTVYIKEMDKPVFKRFLKYIQKDERLMPLRRSEKTGIMSLTIMQLVLGYVNKAENGEIPGITEQVFQQVSRQIPAGDENTS